VTPLRAGEGDRSADQFQGRQIADAITRLNQSKKQHPILICDEAHLLPHPALEQLPLLLNFNMDSSRYLTLLLVGQSLLRRTLSLQMHEALRQRIGSLSSGGAHPRGTRCLSGPATQGRRCDPALV
jgi:type II secretory pathway predicted ATPase ExeA